MKLISAIKKTLTLRAKHKKTLHIGKPLGIELLIGKMVKRLDSSDAKHKDNL